MGTSCYSLLRDVPTHIANGTKDIVVIYTGLSVTTGIYWVRLSTSMACMKLS